MQHQAPRNWDVCSVKFSSRLMSRFNGVSSSTFETSGGISRLGSVFQAKYRIHIFVYCHPFPECHNEAVGSFFSGLVDTLNTKPKLNLSFIGFVSLDYERCFTGGNCKSVMERYYYLPGGFAILFSIPKGISIHCGNGSLDPVYLTRF